MSTSVVPYHPELEVVPRVLTLVETSNDMPAPPEELGELATVTALRGEPEPERTVHRNGATKEQRLDPKLRLITKLYRPFVDYEAAAARHPDVFEAVYEDVADRHVVSGMINHYAEDPSIMGKVHRSYRTVPDDGTKPKAMSDPYDDMIRETRRYRLLVAYEEKALARNMKLGVAAYKKMQAEDTFDDPLLRDMAREGVFSYHALYETNLGLAIQPTEKVWRAVPHLQKAALLSYAFLGVQRAIVKFDETKDMRFSTYAVGWIKGFLQVGADNLQSKEALSANGELPGVEERAVTEDESEEIIEGVDTRAQIAAIFGTDGLTLNEQLTLSFRNAVFYKGLCGTKVATADGELDYEKAFAQLTAHGKLPSRDSVGALMGVSKTAVEKREKRMREKILAQHAPDN